MDAAEIPSQRARQLPDLDTLDVQSLKALVLANWCTLRPDKESNTELYGSGVTNRQVVMCSKKRSPVAAAELTMNLNKYPARQARAS